MKNPLCLVRLHWWGPIDSDAGGALQRCQRCGKAKRLVDRAASNPGNYGGGDAYGGGGGM